jgi:hypothetical protein
MTRKRLQRCFAIAISCYALAILLGIGLKVIFTAKDDPVYSTYKDLVPFLIAIPAAWLGLCIQQRNSYMQQLRKLWSDMVSSVQEGIQYTFLTNPTSDQYARALSRLSCAIEEVRGVFGNLPNGQPGIGLYPFEGLKTIRSEVMDLGCNGPTPQDRAIAARRVIIEQWNKLRSRLLREFDRDLPTWPQSPYITDARRRDSA